jgi:hypothetical protein
VGEVGMLKASNWAEHSQGRRTRLDKPLWKGRLSLRGTHLGRFEVLADRD